MPSTYSKNHSALHAYYVEYKLEHHLDTQCFYCGTSATTKDHVPALADAAAIGLGTLREKGIPLYIVQCCQECNSTLAAGNDKLYLWRRAVWLIAKYTKIYKAV